VFSSLAGSTFQGFQEGSFPKHHNPSISIKVFPDSGQIHADKCPGPGGLAGPDMACCRNGFPWTPHTRVPSGRFCMTQSGVFTIFDIAQILTSCADRHWPDQSIVQNQSAPGLIFNVARLGYEAPSPRLCLASKYPSRSRRAASLSPFQSSCGHRVQLLRLQNRVGAYDLDHPINMAWSSTNKTVIRFNTSSYVLDPLIFAVDCFDMNNP
jgi:hypothetical protein